MASRDKTDPSLVELRRTRSDQIDPASLDDNDWDRLTPPGGAPLMKRQPADPEQAATRKMLPARYVIKEDDNGPYLSCLESANLSVRVQRGLTVSASAARKYPEGTIFLDGAAQGEPFLDPQRRIYNLDHHEGCVRAFTLATCEQAMVVILRGLDLGTGSWKIYANEPDLDTVLAIWLLLNHMHIASERVDVKRRLLPLVRLQGVIDAQGLELKELAALSDERMAECETIIDRLRSEELRLKKEGRWATQDPLRYTELTLRSIDELVYSPWDFVGLHEVEELARIQIGPGRMALICTSEKGIYEVEQVLRKKHGDRIGLIVLKRGPGEYTIRQTDPFLQQSLERLYERLNLLDPKARGTDRWGGSDDIGGSPRGSGTGLSESEIADACQWVFRPPPIKLQARAVLVAMAAALVGCAGAAILALGSPPEHGYAALLEPLTGRTCLEFFGMVALWGGVVTIATTRRSPRLAGWRRPQGWASLALTPLAVVAALAGGSWAPTHLIPAEISPLLDATWSLNGMLGLLPTLALPLVAALAAELLLRGGCHAILAQRFRVMRPGGPWRLSVPILVSGLLSGVLTPLLLPPPSWLQAGLEPRLLLSGWVLSGLALGLVCGAARERSGSLLAPIVLHGAAALAAWTLIPWLLG